MDCNIKTQSLNNSWNIQITTAGYAVIMRATIYTTIPNGGTICIILDRDWPTVSDWERDIRLFLSKIVNEKDIILECRIRSPRYLESTETEMRVREVVCQILGIPVR